MLSGSIFFFTRYTDKKRIFSQDFFLNGSRCEMAGGPARTYELTQFECTRLQEGSGVGPTETSSTPDAS